MQVRTGPFFNQGPGIMGVGQGLGVDGFCRFVTIGATELHQTEVFQSSQTG